MSRAMFVCAVLAGCGPAEFRGSRTLEPPRAVPRIAAGTKVGWTMHSQLEHRSAGGFMHGDIFDPVEPRLRAARVEPATVATAWVDSRPDDLPRVRIKALRAGAATVIVTGEVDGHVSDRAFPIEVVEAGALAYDLDDDVSAPGQAPSMVARGFCYGYTLRVFDREGAELELPEPWNTALANTDDACGGVIFRNVGRGYLPSVGAAAPIPVDVVEPRFELVWTTLHGSHPMTPHDGLRVRDRAVPRLIGTDADGARVALPLIPPLRVTSVTPETCITRGYGVEWLDGAVGACRVVVHILAEHQVALTTVVPIDELPRDVAPFGAAARLAFGMSPAEVAAVAPALASGEAEVAHRRYQLIYRDDKLDEIRIFCRLHEPTELASWWPALTDRGEATSSDGRIRAWTSKLEAGYMVVLTPAAR